jgi:hypothetical protein
MVSWGSVLYLKARISKGKSQAEFIDLAASSIQIES